MSLKIPIKAGSITNLTDARFFAAYEVAYLGFCFDPQSPNYISPQTASAIKGWIHGPKIVAEFANQDIDNILNIISFLQPDIIQLADEYFTVNEIKFTTELKIIRRSSINNLDNIKGNYLFILIDDFNGINFPENELPLMFDVSFIDHELVNPSFNAIQINGGPENEVGIKNYEELAELLDNLVIQD